MYSGKKHGKRTEDEYGCAVPLEDAVVVFDTEVMDAAGSVGNERTQSLDDHEGEVVVDSDDDGTDYVGAMKGLSCDKIRKRQQQRTGYLWRSCRKDFRQSTRPVNVKTSPLIDGESETDPYPVHAATNCQGQIFSGDMTLGQAKHQALVGLSNTVINMDNDRQNQIAEVTSGTEVTESKNMEKEMLTRDIPHEDKLTSTNSGTIHEENVVTSDHDLARLCYIDSQEPEEPSQSDALDFVNRYLSANNLNLPEEDSARVVNRVTSPPLLNVKGPQSLARRANLKSSMESAAFDWHEDQNEKGETNLAKELDGDLDVRSPGVQLENDKDGSGMVDWLDVGFGTQLAAEAMEALVHATPNYKAGYGFQGSSDITERSSEVAGTEKRSGNGTSLVSVLSNSIVTRRRSKRMKRSARILNENVTFSPGKCDQCQKESISSLAVMKKGKGNGSLTETNLNDAENKVNRRFCGNKSKQRKISPRNNFKRNVGDQASSKSNKSNLHDEGPLGENFWNFSVSAKRKRCQPSYSSFGSFPDPTGHSEDTLDHVMEFDASKKRKAAGNSSDGVQKKLKTEGNCSNLVSDTSPEDKDRNKLKVHVCPDRVGTTGLLKLDCWSYPRKKRTPVSFKHHFNRSNYQFTMLELVDEKNKMHPAVSNKSIQRFAGPLLVYKRQLKSTSKTEGSQTLSKQNTSAESSPGLDTSSCAMASGCTIHAKLGKGKSLKHSSELDNSTSLHTIHNSDNTKFNQGSKDNSRATLNHESNEECKLTKTGNSRSPLMKELSRLGYAESLPDFIPKGSRRRRAVAHVCVLFSQNLDATIVRQQKKILARIGFSEASCCSDATHFIADKFLRTRNMLETIALGKPVVTPSWLESCGQAGYLIDEKSHILRDAKKEKEIGFCMPVSLARASQHPLLHGQRVHITPNVKPNKDLIQSLVKAVQGEVVHEIQQAEVKCYTISQDILILSCEEDYTICVPFLEEGTAIYSSELLLSGIITQKLQYKRHQLFTDYTGKNSLVVGESKTSLL